MRDWINLMEANMPPATVSESYCTTLASKFRGETRETFTEVFINPSLKEMNEMRAIMNEEPVKGLLLQNNDVVMWAGHRVHHKTVVDYFDISGEERLMFLPDCIMFYSAYDTDRNKEITQRIKSNRILQRWHVAKIVDHEGLAYPPATEMVTEAKVEDIPMGRQQLPVRVWINPTRAALTNILVHTPDLRAVADGENVYFFPALQATHVQAERALMACGLIARGTYPLEIIFLCPKGNKLCASYGRPRPFDDRFEMRCENRWEEVMGCRNFARLMPRQSPSE